MYSGSVFFDDPLFFYVELFFVFILGLALGSFSTALIYRIPRGISWVADNKDKASRSKCTQCGHVLGVWDLIPFFSWLFLKGRCRYCKHKFSALYPLTELLSAILCCIAFLSLGLELKTAFIIIAIPFLLALIIIDFEHYILPNQLNVILFVLGGLYLFASYFSGDLSLDIIFYNNVLAAFLYGFTLWLLGWMTTKVLKKEALGFGDVKFFVVAGLWLGFQPWPYFLILSGVIGIAFSVFWRVYKKVEIFPFGPSLIASFFILLLLYSN